MSDRKYRQRGYQDSDREKRAEKRPERKREQIGPRTLMMPGTHSVQRCGGCGTLLPADVDSKSKCPRCGFELHSCKQCAHFDPSYRFECTQPVLARIPRKDARNDCSFYAPRVTVERQTSPDAGRAVDARKAFAKLFKI